jgi:hypothetical protein
MTDDQITAVMNSTGMDFLQARNHLLGRELALQAHEQARRKARMEAEDRAIAYEQTHGDGTSV